MKPKGRILKSALVGILALLFLNFPFLGIANRLAMVMAVPVLYVYVFGCWFIILLFLLVLAGDRFLQKKGKHE